jgi:DNA-binding MarR family transcriptional regulator
MNELDRVGRIQEEWRREMPEVDVSPQGIIGRLHRLAGYLTTELVAVYQGHGLGEGEFDVLAALRRAGPPFERAPGDLARHTMVTTGAMTKRLDRLVAQGLVVRRAAESDGRRRVVALTATGIDRINSAFSDHMANERRLLEVVPAEDRQMLEAILTAWVASFEPPATG